jgi:hypothetical protein
MPDDWRGYSDQPGLRVLREFPTIATTVRPSITILPEDSLNCIDMPVGRTIPSKGLVNPHVPLIPGQEDL